MIKCKMEGYKVLSFLGYYSEGDKPLIIALKKSNSDKKLVNDVTYKEMDIDDINEKELDIEREHPVFFICRDEKWYHEARLIHIRGTGEFKKEGDFSYYENNKFILLFNNDEPMPLNDEEKDIPKVGLQLYLGKEEQGRPYQIIKNKCGVMIDCHIELVKTIGDEKVLSKIPMDLKQGNEDIKMFLNYIEQRENGEKMYVDKN